MAPKAGKSPNAFRTISEVADSMGIPQHVLRFWETKFTQIDPMKRGGGRRYYRPEDVDIIEAIRKLLHEDGYTIKGAQKYLKEHGVKNALKMVNAQPDQKEEIIENDYESQILNITKKSIRTIEDEANTINSLKKIRIRLEIIRTNLKE
ncbi:Transcriptional regulator PA2737, MerR family [hydrothermal vent metagenome]|uniref:Transcriptional regulator PA2737, MerR family n=1 Tax=hydrothermal vent metagenome TaxID=652676 RepID=A0A3B0RZC9_9ZZZZ